MRNGWVLQKGLKLWPQDLCRRELHLSNVRGKWSKDLINSSMNYLSRESWDTESWGTFWIQETKSGFAHCKPGPVWSFFFFFFYQVLKQCPGGTPAAETQLHCGLTCLQVLYSACPLLPVVCDSSSPIFTEPSQKPVENWSLSQAANLFIDELFLRGHGKGNNP